MREMKTNSLCLFGNSQDLHCKKWAGVCCLLCYKNRKLKSLSNFSAEVLFCLYWWIALWCWTGSNLRPLIKLMMKFHTFLNMTGSLELRGFCLHNYTTLKDRGRDNHLAVHSAVLRAQWSAHCTAQCSAVLSAVLSGVLSLQESHWKEGMSWSGRSRS